MVQDFLDNCLVSFGSNLRSGHMLKNVPAFLTFIGNITNQIKHGQLHIEMPKDTALCNLWLTMLKLCDIIPVESFGDSDREINELFA